MQIDRDEVAYREDRYYQIKILTEEGRARRKRRDQIRPEAGKHS